MFNRLQEYTKEDIYKILSVPVEIQKGAWDTGYRRYDNCIYIFCNIGVAGRTGHDYDNHWDGNELVWYAKTNTHLDQPLIKEILHGNSPVYVFTRKENRAPFIFQGKGTVKKYEDTIPVRVTWSFP